MNTPTTKPLVIAYSNFFVVRFSGLEREVVIEITQPNTTWSEYHVNLRGDATRYRSRSGETAMMIAWALASGQPAILDDVSISMVATNCNVDEREREAMVKSTHQWPRSTFGRVLKAVIRRRLGFAVSVRRSGTQYKIEPSFDKKATNWDVDVLRRHALLGLVFGCDTGSKNVSFSVDSLEWGMRSALGRVTI